MLAWGACLPKQGTLPACRRRIASASRLSTDSSARCPAHRPLWTSLGRLRAFAMPPLAASITSCSAGRPLTGVGWWQRSPSRRNLLGPAEPACSSTASAAPADCAEGRALAATGLPVSSMHAVANPTEGRPLAPSSDSMQVAAGLRGSTPLTGIARCPALIFRAVSGRVGCRRAGLGPARQRGLDHPCSGVSGLPSAMDGPQEAALAIPPRCVPASPPGCRSSPDRWRLAAVGAESAWSLLSGAGSASPSTGAAVPLSCSGKLWAEAARPCFPWRATDISPSRRPPGTARQRPRVSSVLRRRPALKDARH